MDPDRVLLLNMCLNYGIDITGINAEVALGQWEYQLFSKDALEAADNLWISRYILERVAERYNYKIEWAAKPIKGDWNGSGLHTNFSTEEMREEGGEDLFNSIFEIFIHLDLSCIINVNLTINIFIFIIDNMIIQVVKN